MSKLSRNPSVVHHQSADQASGRPSNIARCSASKSIIMSAPTPEPVNWNSSLLLHCEAFDWMLWM